MACATLFMTHALQWLYDESERTWAPDSSGVSANSHIGANELFTMAEALIWVRSSLPLCSSSIASQHTTKLIILFIIDWL